MLWDSQNRMRECVANGVTSTFEYGPDGLRRSMTVTSGQTSTTTNYILDGQNVAQEWVDADSDNTMDAGEVVTYMAGPRGVECRIHYDTQQEKDVFRWYLYDGLGSVLSEVDDEGNVTRATTKYDVYGAAVSQEGSTDSKHHFVGSIGHTTEPSTGGLIYMRARWYDPVTGRFVSEDPAGDGTNWYAYCTNGPIMLADSSGREGSVVGMTTAMSIAAFLEGLAMRFQVFLVDAAQVVNRPVTSARALEIIKKYEQYAAGEISKWRWIGTVAGNEYANIEGQAGCGFIEAIVKLQGNQVIYTLEMDLMEHPIPRLKPPYM